MVGAILTQNTAWTNVEKAILNLKQAEALTPQSMRKLSAAELSQLIRPAGYFNVKAQRLHHFLDFLFSEYDGRLEKMFLEKGETLRKKLLAVKGIGPETADSMLLYAAQKPFFVIDAYTRRIFSRHGLAPLKDDYHQWQKLFTGALPRSRPLFNDYHAQIVQLAKKHCKASQMLCDGCPLQTFY